VITKQDFSAGGINFSAWVLPGGKVAFVVDDTHDDIIPDSMLVLEPDPLNPDRKWDDILRGNFDVDPEEVRPRIDNKYQKLDILYEGLEQYQIAVDEIISHRKASSGAVSNLKNIRLAAAVQHGSKRLADNRAILAKVSKTLNVSEETGAKVKGRIKELKTRLIDQRASVGREPTKAAAAKILKTQSMIESAEEKAKRNNARTRRTLKKISAAEAEIESALARLRMLEGLGADVGDLDAIGNETNHPGGFATTPPPLAGNYEDDEPEEETSYAETDEENSYIPDDEEEVEESNIAPLLADDPNIIDEGRAFRQVELDANESDDITTTPVGEADHPFASEGEFTATNEEEERETMHIPEFKPFGFGNSKSDEEQQSPQVVIPDARKSAAVSSPSAAPSFAAPTPVPGFASQSSARVEREEPRAEIQVQPPVARPTAAVARDSVSQIHANAQASKSDGPGGLYYLILLILVALSVTTLYVYQDKLNSRIMPHLEQGTEQSGDVVSAANDNTNHPGGEAATPPPLAGNDDAGGEAFLDTEQITYIESFNDGENVESAAPIISEQNIPASAGMTEEVVGDVVETIPEPLPNTFQFDDGATTDAPSVEQAENALEHYDENAEWNGLNEVDNSNHPAAEGGTPPPLAGNLEEGVQNPDEILMCGEGETYLEESGGICCTNAGQANEECFPPLQARTDNAEPLDHRIAFDPDDDYRPDDTVIANTTPTEENGYGSTTPSGYAVHPSTLEGNLYGEDAKQLDNLIANIATEQEAL
jgi:hypothetical protein